jgi:hypothetical protein
MTTIAKWCAAGLTACVWSLSFNALADDSAVLKKNWRVFASLVRILNKK